MRIEGTFVRSRIARRILALFLVSAFVPALALGILALGQVRALLAEQAQAQLVGASKTYALNVYEKLLLVHRDLQQMAADLRDGAGLGGAAPKMIPGTYSSLTVVGPGVRSAPILGEPLSWPQIGGFALAHLKTDESVVVVEHASGSAPRVVLLQMIDASQPERFALAAELNPAELWGETDSFSDAIGLCVLAESGVKLFCSQPGRLPESDLPAGATEPLQASEPAAARQATIAGQWQLFLKPKFYTPYWTVIATEPSSTAIAPIEKFTRIFLLVILFSLLLVALLSMVQIRRTMGPLERLIDGIRRLAGADFAHRVEVSGDDEFGELATAFNEMSTRLGRQVDTLKVLSSIDQVILSKLDVDPVFDLALGQFGKLAGARFAEIVVLEPAAAGEARAYTLVADGRRASEINRIRLAPALLKQIAERPEGFWLDHRQRLAMQAAQPTGTELPQRMLVLPITDRGALSAFACLGLPDDLKLADDALASLRDLCHRVAVALAAAARDEQLVYQIRHDDLTGLPNRLLFKERLSQQIASARREGRSLALLYVDLDRFKSVNDSLGHTAGDDLLGQTARRMRACIRESDTLARLGGDEFAIVLPNIAGARSVSTVAEHIVESLSDPFVVGQGESYVSASIGIAICPTDATDGEDLLRKADTAMYRAKDGGRGRFVYFEERMNAEAVERLALERELRQGLLRNEFALHFQPQIDLRTNRICGAEALLRWNHPTRGLVLPGVFISVAEDTGLVEEIGRRVLLDACAQHAAWRAAGLRPPRIAVNVSGRQFRRGDLVQVVDEALRRSGTPATALEIEVTESLFMDDSANAVAVLDKLRQSGVQVAIDDFGTGYSSMSYLKRLPVDILKVDQSFIGDMTENHDARAIAKAIINLGHTLNKSVVAEGVETAEQLALLRRWRCNRIQGYYFSRPLTPDQFAELLRQREQVAQPLGGGNADSAAVLREGLPTS